jgi:hypothetical protein
MHFNRLSASGLPDASSCPQPQPHVLILPSSPELETTPSFPEQVGRPADRGHPSPVTSSAAGSPRTRQSGHRCRRLHDAPASLGRPFPRGRPGVHLERDRIIEVTAHTAIRLWTITAPCWHSHSELLPWLCCYWPRNRFVIGPSRIGRWLRGNGWQLAIQDHCDSVGRLTVVGALVVRRDPQTRSSRNVLVEFA